MKFNKSILGKAIQHKILRWSSILLAIIVFIIGGYHSIIHSDIFLLEEIWVKGNNRIPAEKILSAAEIQIGIDKLYSLDDDKIKRKMLQKFAYVKQVEIKRKIPGILIIEVVERQPVAVVPFHTKNRDIYGLIDIDGFILEIAETPENYPDMIILTDVLKEGEAVKLRFTTKDENIFIKSRDFPLLLDESFASYLAKKLEKKSLQIAQDTLKCIMQIDESDRKEVFKNFNYKSVGTSDLKSRESLYAKILSINTKKANKITLKLKNGQFVFLSSNYLADGLNNFKTVLRSSLLRSSLLRSSLLHNSLFFYNKNKYYDYIDARFEGVVYCGRGPK